MEIDGGKEELCMCKQKKNKSSVADINKQTQIQRIRGRKIECDSSQAPFTSKKKNVQTKYIEGTM